MPQVRVVAPAATPEVRSWALSKRFEWHQRSFQHGRPRRHVSGCWLRRSSTELHEQIFQEAMRRGVLCQHCGRSRALCISTYPAVGPTRSTAKLPFHTSGQSPALAQRLRIELEEQFGPEYKAWLDYLGEAREKLQPQKLDPQERKRLLHELASKKGFDAFRREHKRATSSD